MKFFGLLIFITLAVSVYTNCGCLKCNSNLHVVSPPNSPIKIIYKNNPCGCSASRSLPYSIQVPVNPQTSWDRRIYGYNVQAEKVHLTPSCPCKRSYDVNVQIPLKPRTPSYLSGLKSWTDRIVITPNCKEPVVRGPIIEPIGSISYIDDNIDNGNHPNHFYYIPSRYERKSFCLSKNPNPITQKLPFNVVLEGNNKEPKDVEKNNQKTPLFFLLPPYKVVIKYKKLQDSQNDTRFLARKDKSLIKNNTNLFNINKTRHTKRNERSKRAIKRNLSSQQQQSENYYEPAKKINFSGKSLIKHELPCSRSSKCTLKQPKKPKVNYDQLIKKHAKKYLKANPIKKLKPHISKGAKVLTSSFKKAAVFFTNLVRKAKPLNAPQLQFPDYNQEKPKLKNRLMAKNLQSRALPKMKSRVVRHHKNMTRTKRQINFRQHKKFPRYYDDYENEVENGFDPYDDDNFMKDDDRNYIMDDEFEEEAYYPESNPDEFLKPFNIENYFHPTTMIHLLNTPIRYLNHIHKMKSHIDPIVSTIPKVARESRNYIFDMMKNFGLKAFRAGTSVFNDVMKLNKLPLVSKMRFKRSLEEKEISSLRSDENIETNTIKHQIFQIKNSIEILEKYNYLNEVTLYKKLFNLQNRKNDMIENWKLKGKRENLMDYLNAIETLRYEIFLDIIKKLKEPNQPFKRKLIKILVILQKMKCYVKMLTKHKNNTHVVYLAHLHELNGITIDNPNEITMKLKEDKIKALQDRLVTLDFLNKIIDGSQINKLKEESKIIWEINNIEKLQDLSITELNESKLDKFAISNELKILFDLQKQLESCVEKENTLRKI